MYYFSAILVLTVIFNTGVNARPPSKIVKGDQVDIRDAPYAVMIYDRSRFGSKDAILCGGTIISPMHILTAAHCFANNARQIARESLVVVAGTSHYYFGAMTYEIGVVYIHPHYTGNNGYDVIYRADIAVLELATEIEFGPTQQPIYMASEEPPSKSISTVFGWGANNSLADVNSRTLRGVQIAVFQFKDCAEATPKVPFAEDELCIYCTSGKTICEGDSGGPLVVDWQIAGVLSRGQACRGEATAINVAYYKPWIEYIQKFYWYSRDIL